MGHRYIGAKTQIIDLVVAQIEKIVGRNALVTDLMSGTAMVSATLREAGHTVVANDLMTYSYHHARVALHLDENPKFEGLQNFIDRGQTIHGQEVLFATSPYEKVLQKLSSLLPSEGYFSREFSRTGRPANGEAPRNYFTSENAGRIDSIRDAINAFQEKKQITAIEHSLLIHDLVMATNDVANIAGTYGHYLSKTVTRATIPLVMKPSKLSPTNGGSHHKVYQGYAEEIASQIVCDLCYIDPPYMKRQYAANYHVLETIARGDQPDAAGVSGLRPWRDQYSNFCTKTKIRDSFEQIITKMECSNFLVSYSEDGLLKIDELVTTLRRFGKVNVSVLPNRRFKSNNSVLAPTLTEYLVHLES